MPNLKLLNRGLPGSVPDAPDSPRYLRLSNYCRRYGDSRSGAYRKIGAGLLKAVKCGRTILIVADSAEAYYGGLPAAQIGGAKGSE